MRSRLTAIGTAVLVAVLPVIEGCQTTAGGPAKHQVESGQTPESEKRVSKAVYLPFYDQSDHLRDLLAANDLAAAEKLYSEQGAYFESRNDVNGPLLRTLAEALNEEYAADLQSAFDALTAIEWPSAKGQWPEIRSALTQASGVIETYPDTGILAQEPYRHETVGALTARLAALETEIAADAEKNFLAMDPFDGVAFDSIYPAVIDMPSVMKKSFPAMADRLRSASPPELERFSATYGKVTLGAENWGNLGSLYVSAYLRQSEPAPDDVTSVLAAVAAARSAGFEPAEVSDLNIAFVEVTSRTMLKQGQIEFPAEIDVDLPFRVEKANIEQAIGTVSSGDTAITIIFDVALAKSRRRVSENRRVPSTVLAGYRSEPNPDYAVAQTDVNNAQLKVQQAAIDSASVRAQGCYGAGCLVQGFATLAAGAMRGQAEDELKVAMERLKATPMNIDKPIFEKYSYDLATVRASKAMTVHYYVIDSEKKRLFKSTFDVEEKEDFKVAYSVKSEDPEKDAIAANTIRRRLSTTGKTNLRV